MARLSRYWHTLRHLKPVQVYGRIRFRLARPRVETGPAPALRARREEWVQPARRNASVIGPETFRFLNVERDLGAYGWDDPAVDKLWRYNLHYFDDLNADDAQARTAWHRSLLAKWVRENPPARGSGWEPYPTSLRIVNWIKWALAGNALPPECVDSLAVQTRWLARRLEVHLLGNHLFANAKALLFGGSFFEGREAESWRRRALRILRSEIGEQILSDGGHFERSPMYHALALEDILDLCNVASALPSADGAHVAQACRDRVAPMREWLAAMCHPDGEIGYFNDAAAGIAPTLRALDDYAQRLGFARRASSARGVTPLSASGYVRVERDAAVALLDVAPVGPDYLPGHAHADTLSFELSLFGRRVFVNSGTSCYGDSAERLRQRGTAAHNTVLVDGHDSSEVWAGFRVARRARPFGLHIEEAAAIEVRCAQDGYRRLLRRCDHLRRWRFGDAELLVEDTIRGGFDCAVARFHLHPSVRVEHGTSAASDSALLDMPGQHSIRFSVEGGALRVEPSTWHRQFGVSEPNLCLVVDLHGAALRTLIDWKAS
jgi:uncharacterized heparinase superfamily protein